jgi:hypothetical protein
MLQHVNTAHHMAKPISSSTVLVQVMNIHILSNNCQPSALHTTKLLSRITIYLYCPPRSLGTDIEQSPINRCKYHLFDSELQLEIPIAFGSAHTRKDYLKSTMVARAPLPIAVLASAPLNLLAFVVALPLRGRVTLLACLDHVIATFRCCSTLREIHDRVNDNRFECCVQGQQDIKQCFGKMMILLEKQ